MQVTRTRSETLTCACHIVTTSTPSSSSHPQAAAEHQPTANHTDTNSVGESTPSSSGNSSTSSEDSGNESGGSGQEEGDEETWLSEVGLDLVGEHARCEAASNGNSSSVEGKLQHSTLTREEYWKREYLLPV